MQVRKVAGEGEHFGVVDQSSIMAAATTSSAKGLSSANGKFEVTMIAPISYLEAISWKNRLAAS